MSDVSTAEIKAALDREMSFVFDLLRDEFAEDDLFCEILAADDDAVVVGTGGRKKENRENEDNFKDPALSRRRTVRQGRGTHVVLHFRMSICPLWREAFFEPAQQRVGG